MEANAVEGNEEANAPEGLNMNGAPNGGQGNQANGPGGLNMLNGAPNDGQENQANEPGGLNMLNVHALNAMNHASDLSNQHTDILDDTKLAIEEICNAIERLDIIADGRGMAATSYVRQTFALARVYIEQAKVNHEQTGLENLRAIGFIGEAYKVIFPEEYQEANPDANQGA